MPLSTHIVRSYFKPTQALRMTRPSLITFDAFGTLYTPRGKIQEMYGSLVKDHCGVSVSTETLRANFPKAVKQMRLEHPHYGKHTLSKSNTTQEQKEVDYLREWWAGVIQKTFAPVVLPQDTITMLYNYFNSADAYQVYTDVVPLLEALKKDGIPMAVISNSDSRTLEVLQSLDLYQYFEGNLFLSSHVGFEKPDPRVFEYVRKVFGDRGQSMGEIWHVGDEMEKDCKAAAKVEGWKGILIDRTASSSGSSGSLSPNELVVQRLQDVRQLYLA